MQEIFQAIGFMVCTFVGIASIFTLCSVWVHYNWAESRKTYDDERIEKLDVRIRKIEEKSTIRGKKA